MPEKGPSGTLGGGYKAMLPAWLRRRLVRASPVMELRGGGGIGRPGPEVSWGSPGHGLTDEWGGEEDIWRGGRGAGTGTRPGRALHGGPGQGKGGWLLPALWFLAGLVLGASVLALAIEAFRVAG